MGEERGHLPVDFLTQISPSFSISPPFFTNCLKLFLGQKMERDSYGGVKAYVAKQG